MKLFRSHVARTSVFTRVAATEPSPVHFSSSIFPIGFAHYPARTPTAERCLGNFLKFETIKNNPNTFPKAVLNCLSAFDNRTSYLDIGAIGS